ncbi:MAG: DUF6950 family protein [Janthinobacterium lividum]
MTEMEHRVAAAQATLDAYKGKPFRWGRCDCARIAASHLRRMGHQVRLPAAGSYRHGSTHRGLTLGRAVVSIALMLVAGVGAAAVMR